MTKVLFLGNCQTNAMRGICREMFPDIRADFRTITPYWGRYDEEETREQLAGADLVISQAIANRSTPFNVDDVRSSTRGDVVFMPYVYLDGVASLEIIASKGRTVIKGADLLLEGQQGRKMIHLFEDYCRGRIDMQGPARVRASLNKMAEKEALDCDLTISDYLEEHWQSQPTVYGINHPTQHVLFEMFHRLCRLVGWHYDPSHKTDPVVWGRRAFTLSTRAITPHDAEVLGLAYGPDTHWYGSAYKLVNLAIKSRQANGEEAPAASVAAE